MADLRRCVRCGKEGTGFIRVCTACKKEAQKRAYERWKLNKTSQKEIKPNGYTLIFKNGFWHWEHESGLENGPFETLKEARRDVLSAIK